MRQRIVTALLLLCLLPLSMALPARADVVWSPVDILWAEAVPIVLLVAAAVIVTAILLFRRRK